jgi:hypothetical protein
MHSENTLPCIKKYIYAMYDNNFTAGLKNLDCVNCHADGFTSLPVSVAFNTSLYCTVPVSAKPQH